MYLIRNAELHGYASTRQVADVRCRNGLISEIAERLTPFRNEVVIDAKGGALLPGLHDHHLHLLGLAAALDSVDCGPDAITDPSQLQQVLRSAPGSGWIRGVNYHESVAGELDRQQLDALLPDRPLRLQHRSGILWMLNSRAIEQLCLEPEHREGLERDAQGRLTGRLFRLDHWLRSRMGAVHAPDLTSLSLQLARFGITGITDTGANNDNTTLELFERAIRQNHLHQHIVLMGNEHLSPSTNPYLRRGPVKILLDEFRLPELDTLKRQISAARHQERSVAFHCVTEAQLVFALSALQELGPATGDRIEHASLCPDEVLPLLKASGVAVVTQPGLLRSRGRQYRSEVPSAQHPVLYRCRTFIEEDIPFALSSDAPYGPLNPWFNMQAAVDRSDPDGYCFGPAEKLSPEQALRGYLRDPLELRRFRNVEIGAIADLCLLDRPWAEARKDLVQVIVRLTMVAGKDIRF